MPQKQWSDKRERQYAHIKKSLADLSSWLGANRSDTGWYREDLQRRHGGKDAVSCRD